MTDSCGKTHPEDDRDTRLDRIEGELAIRQLCESYALSVDTRDLAALSDLYDPVVFAVESPGGINAEARRIAESLGRFYRTFHLVGGQVITFDGPDRASGRVHCRAEHEVGDAWYVAAICYEDSYCRRAGGWYFAARRRVRKLYNCAYSGPPVAPFDLRPWTVEPDPAVDWPTGLASWRDFWQDAGPHRPAQLSRKP